MSNFLKKTSIPILSIILFVVSLICITTAFNCNVAYAAHNYVGIVTVEYKDGNYVYTDSVGSGGQKPSLQAVIDDVQTSDGPISFNFVKLNVSEPIIFKGSAVMQGTLNFAFTENKYALTVQSGGELTFSSMTLNSKRGGVTIDYGGKFKMISGYIHAKNGETSISALEIKGSAEITGGTVEYSRPEEYSDSALGYGLSVNGAQASAVISPQTPIKIIGDTAMLVAGNAEINGGIFLSNRAENQGGNLSGYSLIVQDGKTTVNGGEFLSAISDIRASYTSDLAFNGGEFNKSVVSLPAPSKYIDLFGTKTAMGIHCSVTIDITSAQDKTVTLSYRERDGYRIKYFSVDGVNTPSGTSISLSDVKKITPVEDDKRDILLECDGKVYNTLSVKYGEKLNPSTLPKPEKDGYRLKNFEGIEGEFTVTDDMRLNAIMELKASEITFSVTEFTYNGAYQEVEPTIKHELDTQNTYLWEKQISGAYQEACREKNLPIKNVKDSGMYRLSVTAIYGADSATAVKTVEITVNKRKYEKSEVPTVSFSGVYDATKPLYPYYDLGDNFSWVEDITTVPTVEKKKYAAIYNADSENCEDYEIDIVIDLGKAQIPSLDVPIHRTLNDSYKKKSLIEYPLEDNFRWANPEEIPVVNTRSYKALYNKDTKNYLDYEVYVGLILEKGSYGEDKKLEPLKKVYRPDFTLFTLNEELKAAYGGYRLKYSDAYLRANTITAGTRQLECVYNDDEENYDDYVFTLTIDVDKAVYPDNIIGETPEIHDKYSGKPLSAYALPKDIFWADPSEVPTVIKTDYDAYYNADKSNYYNLFTKVKLILQKGDYNSDEIAIPTLPPVTYDRDMRLSDVPLPEGFGWKDGATTPTVKVKSYEAVYCADEINYNPITVSVGLTVNPAEIKTLILESRSFVYDGKEHGLYLENVPYPLIVKSYRGNGQVNAGSYQITAEISQSDAENYALHPQFINGILTIDKAPSVIVAQARYDILEGAELKIAGKVENDEQNLVIPEFTETAVGVYTLALTTAESGNYLAGSFAVKVAINKAEKYIGNMKYPANYDGSYLYGILVNTEYGTPNDAEISFRAFSADGYLTGMEISVTVDGAPYVGKFTAKIKMTDEMLASRAFVLLTADGTEVEPSIENGVYLVFPTDGNDVFYLKAESGDKKIAWYWIPIGISLGLLVIGAVLVVLWKKGIITIKGKAKGGKAPVGADEILNPADFNVDVSTELTAGGKDASGENDIFSDN